jgi:hypothetical protein
MGDCTYRGFARPFFVSGCTNKATTVNLDGILLRYFWRRGCVENSVPDAGAQFKVNSDVDLALILNYFDVRYVLSITYSRSWRPLSYVRILQRKMFHTVIYDHKQSFLCIVRRKNVDVKFVEGRNLADLGKSTKVRNFPQNCMRLTGKLAHGTGIYQFSTNLSKALRAGGERREACFCQKCVRKRGKEYQCKNVDDWIPTYKNKNQCKEICLQKYKAIYK